MEQFVLVPASVYNKSVSVTKQELPKYKAEQPPPGTKLIRLKRR